MPLDERSAVSSLREPIAASWHRANLAGLEPSSAAGNISHADVDLGSALLTAARPVLDDLDGRLRDTAFSTLLVDREGRVAHRWCGHARPRRAMDALAVDIGASLLEEAVGTNALGTVLETQAPINVHGAEHFAVPLRGFSCYGHPVKHPVTKRVEGVLDISALTLHASPLLAPLVARAVEEIEQRLLDGSRVSQKHLLAAFQASASRRRPVVAIGEDLVMTNRAAADRLSPTDIALLRMLAFDGTGPADGVVDLRLESGDEVSVRSSRPAGGSGGSLFQLEPARVRRTAPPSTGRGAGTDTGRSPTTEPVLVVGEPGTGRSTRAREIAATTATTTAAPVTVLTAAAALMDGVPAWAADLTSRLRTGQGSVVVDGVDLLPAPLVDLVAAHLDGGHEPRIVLVAGPLGTLTGSAAALAAACTRREELTPLADRTTEIPDLVARMLREADADPSLHLAPATVVALAAQRWPGNLRELRAVVTHVLGVRRTGAVMPADLPEQYRTSAAPRSLAAMERAERDAIVAALRDHDGNKVRAAAELGISRTTLYAKMRTLKVSTG